MATYTVHRGDEPPSQLPATTYPWYDMEANTYFTVENAAAARKAYHAGRNWCSRNQPECTIRTVDADTSESGEFEVWMVSDE